MSKSKFEEEPEDDVDYYYPEPPPPVSGIKLQSLKYCMENRLEVVIHKFEEDAVTGIIQNITEDNCEIHIINTSDDQVKHVVMGTEGINKIIYYTDLIKKNIL